MKLHDDEPSLVIVDSIMTRRVLDVDADASVREAARRMEEGDVGGLLVVERGEAVGMITERDLARRVLAAGLDPDATRVRAVMSAPLVTIEPSAQVDEAAILMHARRVKRLVVVLGDDVRGILTVTDVAHARPELTRRFIESWIRPRPER